MIRRVDSDMVAVGILAAAAGDFSPSRTWETSSTGEDGFFDRGVVSEGQESVLVDVKISDCGSFAESFWDDDSEGFRSHSEVDSAFTAVGADMMSRGDDIWGKNIVSDKNTTNL